MLARATPLQAFGDVGFNNLNAGDEATDPLMRGFTTVRDVGGPVFGLKHAIDEGIVRGPRIYPSGAMITITSGHGDFRQLPDLPRTIGGMLTRMEQVGGAIVADSPDEVRVRAREQLMQGASQVKLTAGGGVSSPLSPIDVTTFTEPELRAAVEAAENWGTYVAAHAFTSAAIRGAIAAGVKCIEHGFLMDEATAKLIAEKGVWLSLQPLERLQAQPNALLGDQFGGCFVHQEAVFDTLHASRNSAPDCSRGKGMCGDVGAPILGRFNRGAQFGLGEGGHVDRTEGRRHAAARRQLDLGGALHELFARAHAHLVGAIGNYGATDLLHAGEHAADRPRQIGQLAEIPVPAGDRDHGPGWIDTRAPDDALIDGVLETEHRPAHVANGGEAAHQGVRRFVAGIEIVETDVAKGL